MNTLIECEPSQTVRHLKEMAQDCPCLRGERQPYCCVMVAEGHIARLAKPNAPNCRAFQDRVKADG